MKTKEKNVRFWVYWNGDFVKVTVTPSKAVNMSYSTPTDEGWTSKSATYHINELGHLLSEYSIDGSDCDGRLSTYDASVADGFRQHEDSNGNIYTVPCWIPLKSGQRDYTAEAARY